MLQKHKWSRLLQQHPDIKVLWDKLPRAKPVKRKGVTKQSAIENKEEEEISNFDSLDTMDLGEFVEFSSPFLNEPTLIKNESFYQSEVDSKETNDNSGDFVMKLKPVEMSQEINFQADMEEFALSQQSEDFSDKIWAAWMKRSSKIYNNSTEDFAEMYFPTQK